MKNSPLVSILVPYLNAKMELKRCVDSIIRQTYSNIEILLLDNGSVDGSTEIAESYADERVRLLSNPERDLSLARNCLLEASRGDYVFFVDSDDLIKDNAIERLVAVAEETSSDLVVASYEYRSSGKISMRRLPNLTVDNKEDMHRFFIKEGRNFNHAWGKLYKRALFENVRYPRGKHYEDIYTVPRIIENTSKMTVLSEDLYIYIRNVGGISYNNRLEIHKDGLDGRIENCDFYKEKYPKLINDAVISTYAFAFFYLGKIYRQGIKANEKIWDDTIGKIKMLPKAKGQESLKTNGARLLTLLAPKLAGKIFSDYSRVKNG